MLLKDAKISDFFRITDVFSQILIKNCSNLSIANAHCVLFVFFYHLICNMVVVISFFYYNFAV